MNTKIVKELNGDNYNRYGEMVFPCELCEEKLTTDLQSKRCERCRELETRIEADPELASKILSSELLSNCALVTDSVYDCCEDCEENKENCNVVVLTKKG